MGTLFSLSKSATSIALDTSEIVLLLFGVLLTVGLIGEYAKSERWKRLVKTFEMLVIIGVAGELLADGGIFLFSSHLQTIADQEIADLTVTAGNAKTSAETAARAADRAKASADEAKQKADGAVKSASDARTIANGARLESHAAAKLAGEAEDKAKNVGKRAEEISGRLDLASQQLSHVEERVRVQGPRWKVLEDNRDAFIKAMKPFAGSSITTVRCGPVPQWEQTRVEADLYNFIGTTDKDSAGWKTANTDWPECPQYPFFWFRHNYERVSN